MNLTEEELKESRKQALEVFEEIQAEKRGSSIPSTCLLACPFCGMPGRITRHKSANGIFASVHCETRPCRGNEVFAIPPIAKLPDEIKKWNTRHTKTHNQMREREVMNALRRSRWVSVFWLQNPATRWAALNRMEKRGEVSVEVMGYPMYRVRIKKQNTQGKHK